MGSALRKPVITNNWDSIYEEALIVEDKFIKTMNVSDKRVLFNQWLLLRTWCNILLENENYSDKDKKKESLEKIHTNLIQHNVGFLYTIDESFLQTPLLE